MSNSSQSAQSPRSLLQKLWHRRRVAVPTILQMEAVECGAASLAMILAHFGRWVPLEELRVACGVSRDGSKASNILKAARKFGLDARGYRLEPSDLPNYPLPMILFWNFNHFLVLEGIRGNRVYLNDPAKGPRIIDLEELDAAFTGVVLIFNKTPEFHRGGHPPAIHRSLVRRASGVGAGLWFVIIAGLFLVIPGLLVPAFSSIFVDRILVQGTQNWIKPLLVAMALTFFLRLVLLWLQQQALLRLNIKLGVTGSRDFMAHVLKLPMEFFLQRMPADISNRVALNDQIAQTLSGQTASTAINILMIGFYVPIMFYYDVFLSGAALLVAFANLLLLKIVSKKRGNLNQQIQMDMGKTIGICGNGIQRIETLKATGGEADFFAYWAGNHARIMNAQQELGFLTQTMNAGPQLLAGLGNLTILCLGCLRVMDGHLTLGMLIGYQSLYGSFIGPVQQLVNLGSVLQQAEADLSRLDDVLNYSVDECFAGSGAQTHEPQPSESPTYESPSHGPSSHESPSHGGKLRGDLELRQVTFGYSRLEKPLLTEFSMHLRPGSRIALVGASGSGKSTVARLVTGLYRPWSGAILLDGQSLAAIPRPIFANSVAMVDQDIFLFSASVRDNLTLWDQTIPDEVVVQAAKDACIHDVIAARPGAYESVIEQSGGNFSGGQRQRLEIARALTSQPTLLVLDEATSALDPLTEATIDRNLRCRGCSCLIIAHRLSTIRDADEIIVLERGVVVERGTHQTLVAHNGHYTRLIGTH